MMWKYLEVLRIESLCSPYVDHGEDHAAYHIAIYESLEYEVGNHLH